jgi:hypothetical protein
MATPSGEMRRTTPATMQDVKDVEDRLVNRLEKTETRQESYEKKCEEDRAALRGEVHNLSTSVARIEEKTDNQTSMIQPLAEMFKGILANPKVQTAVMGLVLATLGYTTFVVHDMLKRKEQQPQQPQIIVIPQSMQPSIDAGKP